MTENKWNKHQAQKVKWRKTKTRGKDQNIILRIGKQQKLYLEMFEKAELIEETNKMTIFLKIISEIKRETTELKINKKHNFKGYFKIIR